ncbi:MAG: hypothetical protein JST58_04775 [Bacteroidetes bacterium]|nr:hypothetical protein [Bacteroidota bacterium]
MKTIYFNIQSKGGAGKSMLTYFQALKHEDDPRSCFVDLDSSTKTSTRQLKFLDEQNRLFEIDIYDNLKKIEREKLFEVLDILSRTDFAEIFIDFGAPESEQFPALFDFDFTVDEFKEFEKSLGAKFVLNIVISGGPSYIACFEYLKKMVSLAGDHFETCCYVNEQTFSGHKELMDEIELYSHKAQVNLKIKRFGNIQTERSSGQAIIGYIAQGKGLQDFETFTSRIIMKRELAKL